MQFRDHGEQIWDFGREFLVRCPRCAAKAVVGQVPGDEPPEAAHKGYEHYGHRRVTCIACGYVEDADFTRVTYARTRWMIGPLQPHEIERDRRAARAGEPTDWYFRYPLWLQTPCAGHILWAYNATHLAFIEAYVGAAMRERMPRLNRSLASRLPRWLKEAKHREEVLRAIERLKSII